MSIYQRIQHAFQNDRLLQLSATVLILMLLNLVSGNINKGESDNTGTEYARIVQEAQARQIEGDLLIIELPATREMAGEATLALLSGRSVLIKDEKGEVRRLDAPKIADGQSEDISDTLRALLKLSCLDDAPEEVKKAISEMSDVFPRDICKHTGE